MIITVMSCQKNESKQQAIRNTWFKDLPKDVSAYFFVGNNGPTRIENDIIYVDAPDDYKSLPIKQFKCLNFLNKNFPNLDFTFNCDDDTYVVPERLLASNPKDYMGYPTVSLDMNYRYAYGGAGFFLSKSSLNKLLLFESSDIVNTHPWADSLIGLIMHLTSTPFSEDYRFNMGKYNDGRKQTCNNGQVQGEGTPVALPTKYNKMITSHFINEENFFKIYNHFHGDEILENKYVIKSEYTSIYFTFYEKDSEWFYHRGCGRTAFTKDIGPFEYLEYAEHAARQEDDLIFQKMKK